MVEDATSNRGWAAALARDITGDGRRKGCRNRALVGRATGGVADAGKEETARSARPWVEMTAATAEEWPFAGRRRF